MIAFRSVLSRSKPKPRVPPGIRIYATGDIHGRADLLDAMFKRIDADMADHPIHHSIEIYLGDYIDRGPASRQVLDQLVQRNRANQTIFLKGNHETLLTRFIVEPTVLKDWQRLGGIETLMSYGITPSLNTNTTGQAQLAAELDQALPESHRQFLGSLKTSFTFGDFFFVHAGVRPGIPLAKQREEDLLWIRNDFLLCEDEFGKIIVHGHTPVPQPDIRPNRINIDTGAYATGQLTCLVLEGETISVIQVAN
jgi:serine/threonine protein phosphatase 1